MKKIRKMLTATAVVVGTVGLLVLSGPKVKASGNQTAVTVCPIVTTLQTASNSISTTAGTAFPIPQGVDLMFQASITTTNASGTMSNAWFGFNFSTDGTLYTTTMPLGLTNATLASNTTSVVSWYVNKTNVTGFTFGRLDYFGTTQTNTVKVNQLQFGAQIP